MPVSDYGLLLCNQLVRMESDNPLTDQSPHIRIFILDGVSNREWQCTVNIKSAEKTETDRRVLASHNDNWNNDFIQTLESMCQNRTIVPGWNDHKNLPSDLKLDYLRQNVINWSDMKPEDAGPSGSGQKNDLIDYFQNIYDKSKGEPNLLIFAFGSKFDNGSHSVRGIHEIHMNQGNDPHYAKSDAVGQDGALFIRYEDEGQTRWFAYFCAFQVQYAPTDDQTGHRLPGSQSIIHLTNQTHSNQKQSTYTFSQCILL